MVSRLYARCRSFSTDYYHCTVVNTTHLSRHIAQSAPLPQTPLPCTCSRRPVLETQEVQNLTSTQVCRHKTSVSQEVLRFADTISAYLRKHLNQILSQPSSNQVVLFFLPKRIKPLYKGCVSKEALRFADTTSASFKKHLNQILSQHLSRVSTTTVPGNTFRIIWFYFFYPNEPSLSLEG